MGEGKDMHEGDPTGNAEHSRRGFLRIFTDPFNKTVEAVRQDAAKAATVAVIATTPGTAEAPKFTVLGEQPDHVAAEMLQTNEPAYATIEYIGEAHPDGLWTRREFNVASATAAAAFTVNPGLLNILGGDPIDGQPHIGGGHKESVAGSEQKQHEQSGAGHTESETKPKEGEKLQLTQETSDIIPSVLTRAQLETVLRHSVTESTPTPSPTATKAAELPLAPEGTAFYKVLYEENKGLSVTGAPEGTTIVWEGITNAESFFTNGKAKGMKIVYDAKADGTFGASFELTEGATLNELTTKNGKTTKKAKTLLPHTTVVFNTDTGKITYSEPKPQEKVAKPVNPTPAIIRMDDVAVEGSVANQLSKIKLKLADGTETTIGAMGLITPNETNAMVQIDQNGNIVKLITDQKAYILWNTNINVDHRIVYRADGIQRLAENGDRNKTFQVISDLDHGSVDGINMDAFVSAVSKLDATDKFFGSPATVVKFEFLSHAKHPKQEGTELTGNSNYGTSFTLDPDNGTIRLYIDETKAINQFKTEVNQMKGVKPEDVEKLVAEKFRTSMQTSFISMIRMISTEFEWNKLNTHGGGPIGMLGGLDEVRKVLQVSYKP